MDFQNICVNPDSILETPYMMLTKTKTNLFWWLDHLEVYLESFEYLIDDHGREVDLEKEFPNDEKSSYYIELYKKHFKIEKFFPKWYSHGYQFTLAISDIPVTLFAVLYPQKQEHRKSVVIHSSFFITQEHIGISILEFLDDNFLIDHIRRLDIALDIPLTIQKLLKDYFSQVHFHSQVWRDEKSIWFHQTYYIGQLQSNKNSKYLIRIYDKLLDTWKKSKWFLYPHLRNNSDVRRIELELRRDECKRLWYSYRDILQNNNYEIQYIFSHYLNKHWNIELPTQIPLTPYQYNEYDLKSAYNDLWYIPQRYLSSVRWYLKKVVTNTWYRWLSQVLSTCHYAHDGKIIKMSQYEALKFLDAYTDYLLETWMQKSLIKKIYKQKFK